MTDDLNEQRMTNAEAVMLCRLAKAACPQQQFDEYTPDMWHELLGDLRFQDAKDALILVVKRQPFVSPAEIRDAVANVRRERLIRFGPLPIPPIEIEDNYQAHRRWILEVKRAIGDGEIKPGDQLEHPVKVLDRVMPNWERFYPSPAPVTRAEIVAETERAKSPEFKSGMDRVRAELAARPEIPVPDDLTLPTPPPPDPAVGDPEASEETAR